MDEARRIYEKNVESFKTRFQSDDHLPFMEKSPMRDDIHSCESWDGLIVWYGQDEMQSCGCPKDAVFGPRKSATSAFERLRLAASMEQCEINLNLSGISAYIDLLEDVIFNDRIGVTKV